MHANEPEMADKWEKEEESVNLSEGNKFDDVYKDYGFEVEKKSGGLTYWAHYGSDISGHKNSYIRGELSGWTDGKKAAVGDDRGRQSFSNPKAMAKWFEKNFKMKKESVNEALKSKSNVVKLAGAVLSNMEDMYDEQKNPEKAVKAFGTMIKNSLERISRMNVKPHPQYDYSGRTHPMIKDEKSHLKFLKDYKMLTKKMILLIKALINKPSKAGIVKLWKYYQSSDYSEMTSVIATGDFGNNHIIESVNEGSFKTTLRPQKKDINKMKVRFKTDPRRVYTLKSVETGRVGGTSYMFAAPGNRKEHFTPKTWDLANKKGWLSLESVKEGVSTILIKKAVDIAKKMSGNMTGAVKKIEKIKKGLSLNSTVKVALRNANESVNEAVEPKGNMAKVAKIVRSKQAAKLGGVMIDMQSANLLMKLWDAVSDKDKEKMNKLNAKMLTTVIKKLWSRINLKLPL